MLPVSWPARCERLGPHSTVLFVVLPRFAAFIGQLVVCTRPRWERVLRPAGSGRLWKATTGSPNQIRARPAAMIPGLGGKAGFGSPLLCSLRQPQLTLHGRFGLG